MGRYVVPCIVRSWRMEKWKSEDYFKAMLMKANNDWNTTTTYIYTPSVNGNAKPTHTVRLVASLSSSIK